MPVRSSSDLRRRLGLLRVEALRCGRRVFQLVEIAGLPVASPRTRGEFSSVPAALEAARRFGVTSCVVCEWACMDSYRVHVQSVEWLLSWTRGSSISREGVAHSDAGEAVRREVSGAAPERRQPLNACHA